MKKLPNAVRCWMTGAEISLNEAFLLNHGVACALRAVLAQRLAVIDKVLADLGRRAGATERAAQLGMPAHAPRLIGETMVQAYSAATGATTLFERWTDVSGRSRARWIEEVQGDARVARRFVGASARRWLTLFRVARTLRIGLAGKVSRDLRSRHIDACIAFLFPPNRPDDATSVNEWLACLDATALVHDAEIAEDDRAVALAAVSTRCALARGTAGSQDASEDAAQLARPGAGLSHNREQADGAPSDAPRDIDGLSVEAPAGSLSAAIDEDL